jgi:hypothetical protein
MEFMSKGSKHLYVLSDRFTIGYSNKEQEFDLGKLVDVGTCLFPIQDFSLARNAIIYQIGFSVIDAYPDGHPFPGRSGFQENHYLQNKKQLDEIRYILR